MVPPFPALLTLQHQKVIQCQKKRIQWGKKVTNPGFWFCIFISFLTNTTSLFLETKHCGFVSSFLALSPILLPLLFLVPIIIIIIIIIIVSSSHSSINPGCTVHTLPSKNVNKNTTINMFYNQNKEYYKGS